MTRTIKQRSNHKINLPFHHQILKRVQDDRAVSSCEASHRRSPHRAKHPIGEAPSAKPPSCEASHRRSPIMRSTPSAKHPIGEAPSCEAPHRRSPIMRSIPSAKPPSAKPPSCEASNRLRQRMHPSLIQLFDIRHQRLEV
jgi:hypothetical protein